MCCFHNYKSVSGFFSSYIEMGITIPDVFFYENINKHLMNQI